MNFNSQHIALPFHKKNKGWRKLRFWLYRRSPKTKLDLFVIILAIILGFTTYIALTAGIPFGEDPDTIIWLLNADIIVLLILTSLIGRRIISLWSNRKKNVAASKLHVQLVLTFGILAALPAMVMTVFSALFFYFGVQAWFSERVETAINKSLSVAEAYLAEHQQVIKADSIALASDFERDSVILLSDQKNLERFIRTQSYIRNLPEMVLFDDSGIIIARTEMALEFLPSEFLSRKDSLIDLEKVFLLNDVENERIRAIVSLNDHSLNNTLRHLYFYVGRPVDEKVIAHLMETRQAVEQYTAIQTRSSSFQLGITFIFITISLLLVMSAIWVGLLMARRLVQPIASLISATENVSKGELSVRVDDSITERVDEFRTLGRAFNHMTEQLSKQREELIAANHQIDERRRFTETVLSGVSSGIIGINENGLISLANENAGYLFQLEKEKFLKKDIRKIIPEIGELLDKAYEKPNTLTQDNILWLRKDGSKRSFLVRIAVSLMGDSGTGAVITFDDVTELESAQRKAAWGDVARRIAHEIKNPLTPIQLATERLNRKYSSKFEEGGEDKAIFDSCTETIIRHVGDIQNMVDEFSAFARMPQPKIAKTDIEKLCREIIIFQKQAHSDIDFEIQAELKPKISADPQLLRQAVTNIIKNGIESIQDAHIKNGKIALIIDSPEEDTVAISILDNGPGISPDVAERVTEPYVTTKEKGSGLGLAIVRRIVEEHKGKFSIQAVKKTRFKSMDFKTGVAVMIQLPLN